MCGVGDYFKGKLKERESEREREREKTYDGKRRKVEVNKITKSKYRFVFVLFGPTVLPSF